MRLIAMWVTVRLFGDLIPLLGRERTIDLVEGATVKALFGLMTAGMHKVRMGNLCDHGFEGGELVVLVNGRNIATLDGAETVLREGDVITLLPPFAGG